MAETSIDASRPGQLAHEIRLLDAVAIVVGTILGSAIFIIPSSIARELGSLRQVLAIWILGGLLSLCGGLSIAELGTIFPKAGGLYVYLNESYGRLVAFLYGWALITLVHSGSIAALSVAFSLFVSQLMPLTQKGQTTASVIAIACLTLTSSRGIRVGKTIQNLFAAVKLLGITAMIGMLLSTSPTMLLHRAAIDSRPGVTLWGAGAALVAVLWAYEGWHVLSFTTGEMINPRRDLRRSLELGIGIICALYIGANLAYYSILSHDEIRNAGMVAAVALDRVYGPAPAAILSALIATSVLGSMNGMVLTGPRVYYAMASDGLFFRAFGSLSEHTRAPVNATIAQGVVAAALVAIGTYEQLFTAVVLLAWVFYGLTAAAVLVLRRTRSELTRVYKVPLLLPMVFVVSSIGVVAGAINASPKSALIAGVALCLGLTLYPIFGLVNQKSNRRTEP